MAAAPDCPDCRTAMEEGFIPDSSRNLWTHARWHKGPIKEATFLGLPVGTEVSSGKMMPITAWRCPKCGLLRSYANKAGKTK